MLVLLGYEDDAKNMKDIERGIQKAIKKGNTNN